MFSPEGRHVPMGERKKMKDPISSKGRETRDWSKQGEKEHVDDREAINQLIIRAYSVQLQS